MDSNQFEEILKDLHYNRMISWRQLARDLGINRVYLYKLIQSKQRRITERVLANFEKILPELMAKYPKVSNDFVHYLDEDIREMGPKCYWCRQNLMNYPKCPRCGQEIR